MSKYRNIRCELDGEKFDSRAEAKRHQELLLLQKAGHIRDLKRQPRYPLTVKGLQIGHYVGDWSYTEVTQWPQGIELRMVCEDKKGMKTPLFRWKEKHFRAEYQNIELRLS